MTDERWSGAESDQTEMLEVPTWLEKERERFAEATESEGATSLIDTSEWKEFTENASTSISALADSHESHGEELPLLDAREAIDLPFERLEKVCGSEQVGLDELAALLPGDVSMGAIEEAVAAQMAKVLGRTHRVRWQGMGTTIRAEKELDFEDGIWAWGRVPGRHQHIVVGVDRRLGRAWIEAVSEVAGESQVAEGEQAAEEDIWGVEDDFERGVIAYLIAEFCGVWAKEARWAPIVWTVNSMNPQGLAVLLEVEEMPVLEILFLVSVEDGVRGTLRMRLPVGLLRYLSVEDMEKPEMDSESEHPGWWGGLLVKRPLVVGRTLLRHTTLEGLEVGDVVVVKEHGMQVGEVASTAVEAGARWMVGDKWAVTGSIRSGAGGEWQLEVSGEQINTARAEVKMTESERDEEGEVTRISVEASKLELEVRIGSVEMELGAMGRLRPGQILDCDRPMGSPVDLVVAGTEVGRGELVSVDGKLGVRILAMTAGRR